MNGFGIKLFHRLKSILSSQRDRYSLQKLTLLGLYQFKGVGYHTLKSIYNSMENITDIWELTASELKTLLNNVKIHNEDILKRILTDKDSILDLAQNELDKLLNRNIQFILDTEQLFPKQLKVIDDPPPWLFVEGNVKILSSNNIIAIVGTRKPSKIGLVTSRDLSRLLTNQGYVVLSGLAEGIDEEAHRANIESNGKSIAVLGSGINIVFPASTINLRHKLLDKGGSVITEYFPDEFYSKRKFYWRNRIQSALSIALIPVECKIKGGTAHTINFALKSNKPIYGVLDNLQGTSKENEVFQILQSNNCEIFDIRNESEKLLKTLKSLRDIKHVKNYAKESNSRIDGTDNAAQDGEDDKQLRLF